MKKMVTLIMVLNLTILTAICSPSLAETQELAKDDILEQNMIFQLDSLQDVNETEPQPVNLYFYGDGGDLKAEMPAGNASTEVPCYGSNTPRFFGTSVGTWTSSEINAPVNIGTTFTCSVWAKSDMGANNVYFHLWIRVNGNNVADIWTNTQGLSGTPSEFTGDDTAGGEIQLNPGDTIEVEIIYFADSQYFVGPAPDSTLLVGGTEVDTHITITAAPITLSVAKPVVDKELKLALFIANFTDAFSSKRLNARLMVTGEADVITISDPVFSLAGNASTVAWLWDYKTDKGKCGEYTISVFLSYSEENEFFATGTYTLELSDHKEDEGILAGLGWLLPLIIVVVIIAVVAIVVKVVLNRRSAKISET